MKFQLIDRVLEHDGDRLVAVKLVSAAEEYLQDHFPTFPVLPGVMMLEAMVQAGQELAARRDGTDGPRLVLGGVKALKYGNFVAPGSTLRVEVNASAPDEEGAITCKGTGARLDPGSDTPTVACAGRFTLRPVRLDR